MLYQNEALNEIVAVDRFKHLDLSEIDRTFPVKLGSLCEALGIIAQYDNNLPAGHSGCLDGNRILFSPHYHPTRQKFTVAHEMAHFIFHGNGNRYDDREKYTPEERQREIEANNFAARLLMPKEEFIKKYNEYKDDYPVAYYFDVSRIAVNIRAINLGLINNV